MNMLTIKKIVFGLALTTAVVAAKAQKTYTRGTINYNINVPSVNMDIAGKCYFSPDSSAVETPQGPATITVLATNSGDYLAVLVNIPVAQRKLAAVLTPGEIEEGAENLPEYTLTATTETKKIGDYNCVKYIAKEAKTNANYDVWITKDIMLTPNIMTRYFKSVQGTPIQFPFLQPSPANGKMVVENVTLSSISADTPPNSFKIASDYTSISYSDLKAMAGRRQ